MKKRISRVAVLQNAKFMAVLYLVLSIPFVLLFGLISMFMPNGSGMGGGLFLILAPIFYAVGGFIFTVIGALVYNLVAGLVGGIEYTSSEVLADD